MDVEVYFEQLRGIKRGFEKGTSGYAEFVSFGYNQDDDCRLAINEPSAKVVWRIFEMRRMAAVLGQYPIGYMRTKSPRLYHYDRLEDPENAEKSCMALPPLENNAIISNTIILRRCWGGHTANN